MWAVDMPCVRLIRPPFVRGASVTVKVTFGGMESGDLPILERHGCEELKEREVDDCWKAGRRNAGMVAEGTNRGAAVVCKQCREVVQIIVWELL